MSASSDEFAVTVPGGLLEGWRAGSGPPVLILHGGPGLSDYTSSLADELVEEFTVYRYQQRGLEPSTTDGPFTVESHASDVLAVIDAMSDGPPFLVGHSWGGYLAMHVAAAHPERLRGLVVVDPLGAIGDGGEADMGRIMDERIPPEPRPEPPSSTTAPCGAKDQPATPWKRCRSSGQRIFPLLIRHRPCRS